MANTFIPIQSFTLSSPAVSVVFSSIPQTYSHLIVRFSARGTESNFTTSIKINLNNNTGTVNSYTNLTATGTTVSTNRTSGFPYVTAGTMPSASNTANTFGSCEILIPNYTSSTNKSLGVLAVSEGNTTTSGRTRISPIAGMVLDTNPVTRIDLTPDNFSFDAGSSFYLYGISNS